MYIVLWLEGPLQSWGHDSKFGVRETVPFPTKSGVSLLIITPQQVYYCGFHDTITTIVKYLQEAQFAVFVEVPDDLGPEIAAALVNPVWPLCLGRKSCVPSKPVFVGTCEKECELMTVLGPIVEGKKIQFRVVEGNHPDQGEVFILNDVPICFGDHKEYESRYVTVVKEPADE